MNWPTQYDITPTLVDVYKPDYSNPVEGFMPGQAESLSKLVQRLAVGQAVPMVGSGVYGEDQLFDSEMVDRFDVLDKESDLRAAVSRRQEKAAEVPESPEKPPQESTPPA